VLGSLLAESVGGDQYYKAESQNGIEEGDIHDIIASREDSSGNTSAASDHIYGISDDHDDGIKAV